MVRVLVIAESSQRADVVRAGLRLAEHELLEVISPDSDLQDAVQRLQPDAIVLESESPDADVLDRLGDVMGSNPLPVVIFAHDASPQTIDHMIKAGVGAYVVDGLQAERVPSIIQIARSRFELMTHLHTQLEAAQQKLAERRFVERAKGLLMKARNLSEDEAYHTLRRMAMERNRRMGEVARSVLEMADLLS